MPSQTLYSRCPNCRREFRGIPANANTFGVKRQCWKCGKIFRILVKRISHPTRYTFSFSFEEITRDDFTKTR